MDESNDVNASECMFYHCLCDLNLTEFRPESRERILNRKNIKLLTYNIFLRPPPVKNNESDWKDERLADFSSHLHHFDIICLQEMFGAFNSRKQSLIRAATKAGFFFYVDTSSPSFMSKYMVDGGLVILSRFPIASYAFCAYRYGVIADSLSQKGLLYAKIKVKDAFLFLFSTHLQASYFDSGEHHFQISCETRMAQIAQINKMMAGVLKEENYTERDKILLVGDFNVDAGRYHHKTPKGLTENNISCIEGEYQRMIDHLNSNLIHARDAFKHHTQCHPVTYGDCDPGETCLTHVEDVGSRQTLDYIFECFYEGEKSTKPIQLDPEGLRVEKFLLDLNEQKQSERVYTQLSDHYGLSCELVYVESIESVGNLEERIQVKNGGNFNVDETNRLLDNI